MIFLKITFFVMNWNDVIKNTILYQYSVLWVYCRQVVKGLHHSPPEIDGVKLIVSTVWRV